MADEYEIICIDEAFFRREADKRRCWSPIGKTPIVYVNGSTQNTSVYGAYTHSGRFHYKFVEKQLAIKTIAFFERLRKIYKKIIFIVDKARWHTAKIVEKYIAANRNCIKIFYLPTACPDVNPTEECWRLTRQNVTANTAFDSVDMLKSSLRAIWNKQKFQHKIINYLCR